ncbi:hypothetical protein ACM9HF_02485 [Colwellia sp. RE-S-Sl-9]
MHHASIKSSYNDLLKDLADINLIQQVANAAFKREFDILNEFEKNKSPDSVVGNYAFGFDNPFSGKVEKYEFRKTSISDLKSLTMQQKNNQYCWLLANAFEKFESYVNYSYEVLTTKTAPRKLNKVLAYFSENYPQLNESEKRNKFKIHLKIAVILVEKLRHSIVHMQGCILEPNAFINKVIEESGINNDRLEHEDFIQQFIFNGKVYIVEQPIIDNDLLPRYHDIYRYLVSYLLAYAFLIKEHAECNVKTV